MAEPKNKSADMECPDCGNQVNIEEDDRCDKCDYPVRIHLDKARLEAVAEKRRAEQEAKEKKQKEDQKKSQRKGGWF